MPDQPIPHRYVRCEKCKAPWMLPTTIEPDRLRACPKCCTPADLAQGPILRGFSKRGGAADGQTYSQVPAGVQPPKSTAQPLGAFRRLSSDAEESHGYAQVNGFTQRPSAEKEHPQTYISQPTDCAGPPTQTCLAAPLPSVGQDDQPLYPRIFPHGHILQENYAEDRRNGLYALQDSIRSQLTKQRRIRVPFIAELSSIAQQILSARGQGLSSAPDLDIIHGIDSDDMLNLSIDDTRRSAGNEVSDFQLEGKHSPIDQRNQTSIVSELPSHTVATKQVLATEGPLAKDRDTASQTTCDPPMPGQKPIYRKVAILPSTPFSHYELDLILQLYGKSLGCGHQLRLGWITQGTSLTGFDRDPASLVVVFYDPDSRCHWKGVRHRDPAVDGLLQELDGAGASVDQDDEDDNPYRTRRWLPKHRDDFKCHPCFIEGKKCDGKSPCSTCVQRRSVCREQDPESTAQILDAAHKPRIFDPKSRRPRTDPCAACFRSRIMTCDGVVPCNNCRSAGRASQCNWDHKVAKKKEQRGSQSEGDRPLPLAVSVEERYCSGCGHLDHTFHGFRYSQIENHRHQHVCDRCFVEEGETGRHSSHSRERKCWYCFKENVEGRSFTVALVDGEEGRTWCPDCRRSHRRQLADQQEHPASNPTDDESPSNLTQVSVQESDADGTPKKREAGLAQRFRCCACGTRQSHRFRSACISGQPGTRWCEKCYRFWKTHQVDPYDSPVAILARTGRGVVCAGNCGRVDDGTQKFSLSKLDRTKFWCGGCSISYSKTGKDPALSADMKCSVCGDGSPSWYQSKYPDEQGQIWCHNCYVYWREHGEEHPRSRPEVMRMRDRQRMLDLDTDGSEADGV